MPSPVSNCAAIDDADDEGQQRDAERRPAWAAPAGRLGQRSAVDQRRADERARAIRSGEPGEVVHARFTASRAGRRAGRRRAGRGRRSGRSRSAPAAAGPASAPTAIGAAGERAVDDRPCRWSSRPATRWRPGFDDQRVVDRVAVEVGAGGAGHERDVLRSLARHLALADQEPGDARRRRRPRRPTISGDRERRDRRLLVLGACRRPGRGSRRSSR